LLVLCPLLLRAQTTRFLQHGFEGRDLFWTPGPADAPYKQITHALTDETRHGGHQSECIELQAQQGTAIHYVHAVGRGPVTEELTASVWIKANRPGTQLLARVVLPHERNPKDLSQPLTTLLRGDVYQTTGRWQPLELRQPQKLLKGQQQLLRAELHRDVTVADAYLDQLILNVYGGPGLTRVWTDDLQVGPLVDDGAAGRRGDGVTREQVPSVTPSPRRPVTPSLARAEVKLENEKLVINARGPGLRPRPLFLRAIRYSGVKLETLRDAGFNTVWLDETTDAATIQQAVNLGFWLVPSLAVENPSLPRGQAPGVLASNQLVGRRMAPFLQQDAVLCWDFGGGLAAEQYVSVQRTANAVRSVDPSRPLAVDVWDGFQSYSRGLDQVMLGIHRWPLMTGLELTQYHKWLTQRRRLAQPGTFCWTWVQTHLPDWYCSLVYEKPGAVGFNEPVGPQPEQIRLLAYTAAAAGCRGLGFWSDRFLADSHSGHDRLLQMALLNLEFQLLEPMLVTAQTPLWVATSMKDVRAAVMRTDYGVLCLPIWIGPGSQFVPGQGAVANLSIVVPQVPSGTQPWLISPGEIRALRSERVVGGTRITLPEFGLTAAVVFTSDLVGRDSLVAHLQDQVRDMNMIATQWSYDLAREELDKVSRINTELEEEGHRLPDGQALLEDARRRLERCAAHRRDGNIAEAYAEAQRVLRPLRILMHEQWLTAAKELDLPVASPYAVSFYSLPRHWKFRSEIAHSRAMPNVLPGGDFETAPLNAAAQWRVQQETSLDEVIKVVKTVDKKEAEAVPPKQPAKDKKDTPGEPNKEQPKPGSKEARPSRMTTRGAIPDDPKKKEEAKKKEDAMQKGHALLLEVKPADPKVPAPPVLERTFLAVHSPAVKLPPGTLVSISGWVCIPGGVTASADGVLLYDSAGGEPLAVRIVQALPKWRKFTLYRRVPASGSIHVTLALTGLGKAYFDDIRIEPLSPATVQATPAAVQPVANWATPRGARPAARQR
jgi:hypothetical protein